jgi:hypothetical protein
VTAGASTNAVSFATLWDDAKLYLAVKVTDSSLKNDSTNAWDDDSVEIYLDGGNEKSSPTTPMTARS